MAERLLPDFPDGAFFHVFHAVECGIAATLLTLLPSKPLPAGHPDKYHALADALGEGNEMWWTLEDLWHAVDRRSEALYVGWSGYEIREPAKRFTLGHVLDALEIARATLPRLRDIQKPRPSTQPPPKPPSPQPPSQEI